MSVKHKPEVARRDRGLERVRNLTMSVALGGAVSTGALAVLAAATNAGTAAPTDPATVTDTTNTSTDTTTQQADPTQDTNSGGGSTTDTTNSGSNAAATPDPTAPTILSGGHHRVHISTGGS